MNKRFALELIVGIVLLVSVLLFGPKGMAAFALLAIHPFIKEKEKLNAQLFNKVGNITAGATLLLSLVVYLMSDVVINGWTTGEYWLFYVLAAFLVSHGVSGLIIFNKK